ncbi:MAG: tetratricopeptide repeat protein [Planctomycetes bacterium]|nr:tetratricopeptide repeat protein [Planctomycetota bacterium]
MAGCMLRLLLASLVAAALVSCQATSGLDRGDALLAEGKHAEALALWQEALAAQPRDTALLIRVATAQVRLGRLDDAKATMRQAVAIEPDSPKVRQNLALVYLWRKEHDKALAAFEEVLKLQDSYPETNYYIGLIHEMRGDEEAAVRCYVKDVNNGPSLAWERLDRYKEKQRALGLAPRGPSRGGVWVFCGVCLAVAAAAFGLRLMFFGLRSED